jgi:hypothetical protein
MTTENKVQEFSNAFWKYASDTKGILALEDAYINWANNSGMTIREFGQVWAKINDDISSKFGLKKADISFSRTDDILELADLLKNTGVEDIKSLPLDKKPSTPELNLEPELDLSKEPESTIKEKPVPPSSEGDVAEPGLEEGGAEPELKLTESLLL